MKYQSLKVGMEFKNYKQLCYFLNEEVKTGGSKKAQIKEWGRYFEYSKNGQALKIRNIHESPLEKVENRGRKNKGTLLLNAVNPEYFDLIMDKKEYEDCQISLYSNIILTWRCIECAEQFDESIHTCIKRKCKCKGCVLSKNARRIYKLLEKHELTFVTEHTFEGLVSDSNYPLRYDFALFSNDKLVGLIEYDGEYHSEEYSVDKENFHRLLKHDQMKDTYCELNEIPLLRVGFKESKIIENKTSKFLNYLGLIEYDEAIIKILELENKRKYYIEHIQRIDEELALLT